jgi:Na+/H+ antiporter NhaD/arsenite permease-like protein
VLSSFLDNIAAAVIGGVMAKHLYRGRVSIAFLASIVAAANAGGAGSVIGDTTTTLMWIGGVSPLSVIWAYGAAVPAFILFGVLGARIQQRHEPIVRSAEHPEPIDWVRVLVVGLVLAALIATNVLARAFLPGVEDLLPALGLAIWLTILLTAAIRKPDWKVARQSLTGATFLVALVAAASLMPVDALPEPSWITAFVLGLASSVFDNIPLTALTLEQDGYDWALLAYAVGFGGSMVWFGSSAGVALTNLYPEGRSVLRWLRDGWFVAVAYVVGFFALLLMRGWNPATVAP